MILVGKEKLHFDFDRGPPTAVTVKPGETVTFETLDACNGLVRSVEELTRYRATAIRSNPMTGPVFV